MYFGRINKYDIANGEGVRVTLFVSGCTNHCEGCFQPETWNFRYGQEFTEETEKEIIDALGADYIDGLTLLGGEPFEPENQETLVRLLRKVKEHYPLKTIWSYTGFVLDQDLRVGQRKYTPLTNEMLSYIDVLVDGRFEIARKNLSLRFRGSENQRVIDLKRTLQSGEVVLYLE